jgi:SAM-dependent methyltransferase
MLTELQYRILRNISPKEPAICDGSAYAGKSKVRTAFGDEALQRFRGMVVLDFGCGEGKELIELVAKHGAARGIGVDMWEDRLETARRNAGLAGASDRCLFTTKSTEKADIIISIDAFEHFGDPAAILDAMNELLKPGGEIIISFGSTWYHPYGGHLFSVFPWAHLVFSERALLRWRSDLRSDGATRFSEVAGGLNQMTIKRFEETVRRSPFRFRSQELLPIRKARTIHNRLTREFTTSIIRCILVRKSE